ncbi:purine-nucleoside phosphorylase [Spirochaeta cellobiosiphila]|uniref:purine-nucleoside phosphorylase n=1 Tax=Spirochaeta cellobiosiphila TaxID=504483 RepID=UPI0004275168|nr:purine-nucleoside phosphorylase [Spirochaeta cellobiosiphila]
MSTHIGAKPGDIADKVLMPGDPLRAKWAAEKFLDNPVCYNEVRGMYGFTGTYKGKRVSIQGSGMGMPSFSIYANELIDSYGAKTLIRIGSCGGILPEVKARDVIIAMTASTDSNMNKLRFGGKDFAPSADPELFVKAVEYCKAQDVNYKAGGIVSIDSFYNPDPDAWKLWAEYGILGMEMEANALYTIGAYKKVQTLAICTVSDSLVNGDDLPAKEREQSFADMVEVALEIC